MSTLENTQNTQNTHQVADPPNHNYTNHLLLILDSSRNVGGSQTSRTLKPLIIYPHVVLRCESLVLYRIMYGNGVMEVQLRNNLVVGSDNTENIAWGHGVCWAHGGIKLKQLIQGRNCFCFAPELHGDASPISFTPRFCHPRHRQA